MKKLMGEFKKIMRNLGFMGEEGKGILKGRYASWREFGPA